MPTYFSFHSSIFLEYLLFSDREYSFDLMNHLTFPDSFYWCDRIKVALELARLLAFLHSHKLPYMVRNLDAMHIMIDKVGLPFFLLHTFNALSALT